MTEEKKKKLFYNLTIAVLVAVILFCAFKFGSYFYEWSKSNSLSKNIADDVVGYSDENGDYTEQVVTEENNKKVTYKIYTPPESIDFNSLLAQNSDVVAWLFSPNGVINYPVVKGDNNSYYLSHLLDGSENSNGTLFLDCLNSSDFSDGNSIIHGHSMKSGTMFGTLLRYRNQYYYDTYPAMYLYTPEKNYVIDFIAGYTTTIDDMAYTRNLSGNKQEFIDYVRSHSSFASKTEVSGDDRFVTLITCDYKGDDSRFVLVGKISER